MAPETDPVNPGELVVTLIAQISVLTRLSVFIQPRKSKLP